MNPKLNLLFQGGLGGPPPEIFGFWGRKWCISVPFWVTVFQYPYPPLQKKILFRYTLISRMVLGDGKKSENFDPCPERVWFLQWFRQEECRMSKIALNWPNFQRSAPIIVPMTQIEHKLCHRGYLFCGFVPERVGIWAQILCQYKPG